LNEHLHCIFDPLQLFQPRHEYPFATVYPESGTALASPRFDEINRDQVAQYWTDRGIMQVQIGSARTAPLYSQRGAFVQVADDCTAATSLPPKHWNARYSVGLPPDDAVAVRPVSATAWGACLVGAVSVSDVMLANFSAMRGHGAQRSILTEPGNAGEIPARNKAALELIKAWMQDESTSEEQASSLNELMTQLDSHRSSGRKLFPRT
jgi:hypothetical protein